MTQDPQQKRSTAIAFWLATVALIVSIIASALLAVDHFDLTRLPGCGPQSGCEAATRGPWGTLPVVNWPLSLVGLAWFAAMLVTWLSARQRISLGFQWLARIGGAGSLLLIGVMIFGGYMCKYCLLAHIGNLVFIAALETTAATAGGARAPRVERAAPRRQLAMVAGVFLAATAALLPPHILTNEARTRRAEAALRESVQRITGEVARADEPSDYGAHRPFTGRWRVGPENAPIRIVLFDDYQCTDCKAIEMQVRRLLEERDDISISIRHFPMNALCNPHIPKDRDMHRNACWAARAAEAAGTLRGAEGFWEMHRWLFDQGGSFTDESLPRDLAAMGYDAPEFLRVMGSQEMLDRVQSDIEEGYALGLLYTPMIFVNGVELKGFTAPNALVNTVNKVAATNPKPGTPAQDRPPTAAMSFILAWRESQPWTIPADSVNWARGPADAKASIVVWGDYQLETTRELDRQIREAMAGRDDVRYDFRHFPYDQSCNPHVSPSKNPTACRAAAAAEAAGQLAGAAGFWKMHDWLMAHAGAADDASLQQAAQGIGIDPAALVQAIGSAAASEAVRGDIESGRIAVVVRNAARLPSVYINGKALPRWQAPGRNIIKQIVDEIPR